MQVTNKTSINDRKTLKDYIPLVLGFCCAIIVLSFYQNIRLYFDGVLDWFIGKSLFLLLLHHLGFIALIALVLSFLFKYLEKRKANLGFKVSKIILSALVLVEGALIEHYVQNYEPLNYGMFSSQEVVRSGFSIIPVLLTIALGIYLLNVMGRRTKSFYKALSKMYPLTIVLFGLFLAILNSNKKPINENKTQHYLQSMADYIFDFNKYEGPIEYPLLKPYDPIASLGEHLTLKEEKPNIVVVVIDGLGSDFVGADAKYPEFTPFIKTLSQHSLFWKNHLSNTGESFASLPTILGSLPFGTNGFTNIEGNTNRQTLFSILKENGYATSFNYGGNSALNGLDRFLDEERVDKILDKKGFGEGYVLQREDAAGISLGYPDKELYRKWESLENETDKPRFDVFFTLSTRNPYLIPNQGFYEGEVEKITSKSKIDKRTKRIINKNSEVFAGLIYMDSALKKFINSYKKNDDFDNTIFIITGSHNVKDLPQENNLDRYRVPLIIYSPLLKSPQSIGSLVSHADIAPSVISMLDKTYGLDVPKQVAWLGDNLLSNSIFATSKQIPLFRNKKNIQDFIVGDLYVSNNRTYTMNEHLELAELKDDSQEQIAENRFKYFKAVNKYVTENNKILPTSEALYARNINAFSKEELVWVESVFNGNDFDNAYKTARNLAIDKNWDRALLLANYILSKVPRHADTEVLIGRIHSWKQDYETSISVLKEAIRKYPTYADAYSALLDTYYWADNCEQALALFRTIKRNGIFSKEVDEKVSRAKEQIRNKALLNAAEKAKKETEMVSISE